MVNYITITGISHVAQGYDFPRDLPTTTIGGIVTKASFFRNVTNIETLRYNSVHYSGVVAEYCSVATIHLKENDFSIFCEDFQRGYDYLLPFVDEAVISHGEWKCVTIVGGNSVVLAVMDHYQYPRYLAIISK